MANISRTPEYQSWHSMPRRCYWPAHKDYKNYGARGILVIERWHVFSNFLLDMGKRPEGTSLERVDNAKGYSLENCRWASYTEQNFNRRPHKRSLSGIVGVTAVTVGWRAYGKFNGVSYELYRGPSKEHAIAARQLWEDKYVRSGK